MARSDALEKYLGFVGLVECVGLAMGLGVAILEEAPLAVQFDGLHLYGGIKHLIKPGLLPGP